MSRKLVLHAALISAALGSVSTYAAEPAPAAAAPNQRCIRPLPMWAATPGAVFLFASAFMLIHRPSTPDFKQNGSWTSLLNIKQNFRDYKQNALDIFWDHWIGQQFKDNTVTAKKDGGEIKLGKNEKCLPYGVMGKTAAYLHEGGKAKELLLGIGALCLFVTKPETLAILRDKFLIAMGFIDKPAASPMYVNIANIDALKAALTSDQA